MRFLRLTVENFGVFKGKNSFDLTPLSESGYPRNLTVFSGHNGAGKTTLFHAMELALHGPAYIENGQYNNFILSRMHRLLNHTDFKSTEESSVMLNFQYISSGKCIDIEVERRWQKHKQSFHETLTVLQNGQPPEVDRNDYQVWLDDFISPGLGKLCFFDAEQLDTLASTDQQTKALVETLQRLLGLDLVQRLQGDLDQLISRQGSTARIEHLYKKVLEARSSLDEIEYPLAQLRSQLVDVNAKLAECEAELAQQERLLAAEGGAYAAKRPLLKERLLVIEKEIEALSGQLRELCADLLPFALVPELCLKLSKQLAEEIEIHQKKIIRTVWREKLPEIEAMLSSTEVWQGLEIDEKNRKLVTNQLLEKLKLFGEVQVPDERPIVHHLAEPDQKLLRQWISQAIRTIPQQAQSMGRRLRSLKEEQRRIDIDLKRAPDDAVLAPFHAEISRLREIRANDQKQQSKLSEHIGSLQFQHTERLKVLEGAVEQYDKARKVEKQLKLAEQSRLVLRTYKDALIRQKLQNLEEALVVCFNRICRKEDLLSRVTIDPEDFKIELEGIDGKALHLNNFSAGERQLYALALLWALRMVSQRSLPLAVDTPLARLDEIHRQRLIDDYIPRVSDQVLLFATDAELDADLLNQVRPYLARIYRLKHDPTKGETTYTCESAIDLPQVPPGAILERE